MKLMTYLDSSVSFFYFTFFYKKETRFWRQAAISLSQEIDKSRNELTSFKQKLPVKHFVLFAKIFCLWRSNAEREPIFSSLPKDSLISVRQGSREFFKELGPLRTICPISNSTFSINKGLFQLQLRYLQIIDASLSALSSLRYNFARISSKYLSRGALLFSSAQHKSHPSVSLFIFKKVVERFSKKPLPFLLLFLS